MKKVLALVISLVLMLGTAITAFAANEPYQGYADMPVTAYSYGSFYLSIPESVEFIGHSAFSSCKALTSVAIRGSGIIEYEAFVNCNNLMCVTVSASVDEIQDAALGAYYGMAMDPFYLDGFTIFGYANSEAERYAQKHGLIFSNLSKLVTTLKHKV